MRVGVSSSALAALPSPVAALPPPDLRAVLELSAPGKCTPPRLPSNDAPGCIATRIRVPSKLRPPQDVRPLPTRTGRPRGSARIPPAWPPLPGPACYPSALISRLALTGLRPPLSFTCDFAKTRHQNRASTPGRWFIVCACAGREASGDQARRARCRSGRLERMRPTCSVLIPPPPAPARQEFPPREEWDRMLDVGKSQAGKGK